MALLSDYTAGTISVAADGTAVTGVGTAWQTAEFREGDWFIANGWVNVVASVNSNSSVTLAQPWRGGTLSGAAYRMRYMSDGSRSSAQARQLIDMLGGSGNLSAFAGLAGVAGKYPMFTGAGTMTLGDGGTPDPNGTLAGIAGLTTTANTMPYFTGIAGASALTTLTAFARTLLDDTSAPNALTTLGVTPFAQTLLDDTDAPTARTTLGANDASNLNAGSVPVAQIPATLTADKAYRQGNILSTVSQTSGVPTGGIIERGSNVNGEYVRFADGTQVSWLFNTLMSGSITTASGTSFINDTGNITWTFPTAFVGGVISLGTNPRASARWVSCSGSTSTTANFRVFSNTSGAASIGFDVCSIGRWF
jgi:hypothetical protein